MSMLYRAMRELALRNGRVDATHLTRDHHARRVALKTRTGPANNPWRRAEIVASRVTCPVKRLVYWCESRRVFPCPSA